MAIGIANLVSWCVGGPAELGPPGSYDPKPTKRSGADLPILPKIWPCPVPPGTHRLRKNKGQMNQYIIGPYKKAVE